MSARGYAKASHTMAKAGMIMGVIALVLTLFLVLIVVIDEMR